MRSPRNGPEDAFLAWVAAQDPIFEIGGKPVTFLLDSGAMTSNATPAAAEELGLEAGKRRWTSW